MLLTVVCLFLLTLIPISASANSYYREGSGSTLHWSDKMWQEQRNPISLDQRYWLINIRLKSLLSPGQPGSEFDWMQLDYKYKLPYKASVAEEITRYNTMSITHANSSYQSTHLEETGTISYSRFKWKWTGVSGSYLKEFGEAKYTFVRNKKD